MRNIYKIIIATIIIIFAYFNYLHGVIDDSILLVKTDNKNISDNTPVTLNEFGIFFNYIRITGNLKLEKQILKKISLSYEDVIIDGVIRHNTSEFAIMGIVPEKIKNNIKKITLNFITEDKDGNQINSFLAWDQIEKSLNYEHNRLISDFITLIEPIKFDSVLEIGSRARSGVSRRELFKDKNYIGIDVLPGENVDIIGDAHELSNLVKDKKFNVIFSMSVFEHLKMPWKVVLEMNKVMELGGVAYISTHQTVGMHDLPWDFWRFSDTAWHSLFNKYTGFEIIQTSLSFPMRIVPFISVGDNELKDYEKSAGFYHSCVIVRKIADTNLSWNVPSDKIGEGNYPK